MFNKYLAKPNITVNGLQSFDFTIPEENKQYISDLLKNSLFKKLLGVFSSFQQEQKICFIYGSSIFSKSFNDIDIFFSFENDILNKDQVKSIIKSLKKLKIDCTQIPLFINCSFEIKINSKITKIDFHIWLHSFHTYKSNAIGRTLLESTVLTIPTNNSDATIIDFTTSSTNYIVKSLVNGKVLSNSKDPSILDSINLMGLPLYDQPSAIEEVFNKLKKSHSFYKKLTCIGNTIRLLIYYNEHFCDEEKKDEYLQILSKVFTKLKPDEKKEPEQYAYYMYFTNNSVVSTDDLKRIAEETRYIDLNDLFQRSEQRVQTIIDHIKEMTSKTDNDRERLKIKIKLIINTYSLVFTNSGYFDLDRDSCLNDLDLVIKELNPLPTEDINNQDLQNRKNLKLKKTYQSAIEQIPKHISSTLIETQRCLQLGENNDSESTISFSEFPKSNKGEALVKQQVVLNTNEKKHHLKELKTLINDTYSTIQTKQYIPSTLKKFLKDYLPILKKLILIEKQLKLSKLKSYDCDIKHRIIEKSEHLLSNIDELKPKISDEFTESVQRKLIKDLLQNLKNIKKFKIFPKIEGDQISKLEEILKALKSDESVNDEAHIPKRSANNQPKQFNVASLNTLIRRLKKPKKSNVKLKDEFNQKVLTLEKKRVELRVLRKIINFLVYQSSKFEFEQNKLISDIPEILKNTKEDNKKYIMIKCRKTFASIKRNLKKITDALNKLSYDKTDKYEFYHPLNCACKTYHSTLRKNVTDLDSLIMLNKTEADIEKLRVFLRKPTWLSDLLKMIFWNNSISHLTQSYNKQINLLERERYAIHNNPDYKPYITDSLSRTNVCDELILKSEDNKSTKKNKSYSNPKISNNLAIMVFSVATTYLLIFLFFYGKKTIDFLSSPSCRKVICTVVGLGFIIKGKDIGAKVSNQGSLQRF